MHNANINVQSVLNIVITMAASSTQYAAIISEIKARVDHGGDGDCKCRDFVSRSEFKNEVQAMAKKRKEKDFDREFIRLNHNSVKIKDFGKAIGVWNGNEELKADMIESTIWTLRFAVFEVIGRYLVLFRCADTSEAWI